MENVLTYTIGEVRDVLSALSGIFDAARIVDPMETVVIEFDDDNEVVKSPYTCYQIWRKNERCDNCTSMFASIKECRKMKYELMGNTVFYVVSKPAVLIDNRGAKLRVVLEIVTKIVDESLLEAMSESNIIEKVNMVNRKLYEDSLTLVHNRRYFDEMVFLQNAAENLNNSLVLILLDLHGFKRINDLYGHGRGDKVLIDVASVLRRNVRKQDSVIRMGGDEFVVLLPGCSEREAELMVKRLRQNVRSICYDKSDSMFVDADFGYAYTPTLTPSAIELNALFEKADAQMYLAKRAR